MSLDNENHSSREELKARLTAMVLGEAGPSEEEELRRLMEHDPDLAQWHSQLVKTTGLIREAAAEARSGGEAEEVVPRWIDAHRNLRLRGLMTMAPEMPEEDCRFVFRSLRELLLQIRAGLPSEEASDLQELSMGMSNDYRAAVSEGATMIRLGTVLYQGAGEPGGIR